MSQTDKTEKEKHIKYLIITRAGDFGSISYIYFSMIRFCSFLLSSLGAIHKLCRLKGGGEGQN